jgi:Tfp pilus assembly protein PilN
MINLLPPENKAEIRAGRLNVILLNYITMTVFSMALLAALFVLSYLTLSSARHEAQRRVEENSTEISKYDKVKESAEEYRKTLATAKQILDNSTNYSTLILKIADSVPVGVTLTGLNLDKKTIGTPMVLNFTAKSKEAAFAFKSSLQEKSSIFSNVNFQQVDLPKKSSDPKDSSAEVTGALSITISKGALK